ncbi:MAG: DUF4258 domain-containing protein [Candidatus Acidiferrales bacterium]
MEVVLTRHAREMAGRRQIDETLIREVARQPEQRVEGAEGAVVLQSRFTDAQTGKGMLLRLVAEERQGRVRILTVYKTSRIEKYWRRQGGRP